MGAYGSGIDIIFSRLVYYCDYYMGPMPDTGCSILDKNWIYQVIYRVTCIEYLFKSLIKNFPPFPVIWNLLDLKLEKSGSFCTKLPD